MLQAALSLSRAVQYPNTFIDIFVSIVCPPQSFFLMHFCILILLNQILFWNQGNCNHLVHCQWYPFAPCWTCPQQWGHIVSLLPDPLPRTWLTHWASCQGRSWWRKCFSRLVTWPPSNPIPWLHFRERLKTSRPHFWILTEGVLWDNEIST